MAFYTTTLSPGDFLPLFQLMDDYCDTRCPTKPTQSSRGKASTVPAAPSAPAKPQLPSFTPRFDVRESDNFYILDGELPGAQQENIEIEFTDAETVVIKGQIERNYDITSSSSESTNDNDDVMSVHSDGASSTHSNYHSPTVEDEEDGAVKVNTVQSRSNLVTKHQPESTQDERPAYKYWASERSIGTFKRTFTFPTRVNQDGVKATFKNGILSVFVPKQAIQEAKRIRIE